MQELADDERFIGRTRELAVYESWLNDASQPGILSFYDDTAKKGGIGKTWLLRECVHLTRVTRPEVAVVMIDFFNVQDRGGVNIATRVAQELQRIHTDWHPEAFLVKLEEFNRLLSKGESDVGVVRTQLLNALFADLQRLEAGLENDGRALILFFDTYELIEQDPVIAVLAAGQTFPDTYGFKHIGAVIAGRNEINWQAPNWKGREQEVLNVPLSPFNLDEMVQYMKTRLFEPTNLDEANSVIFHKLTEGRPILIGLTVDVLNYQLLSQQELLQVSRENFEAKLVAQINNLHNPTNWIILFMAHAYHRFNLALLDWMLTESSLKALVPNIKRQSLEENLPTLSFIRHSSTGKDFVLHDEMRRLINQYCWEIQDPDQSYRREVSRCAIRYYQQEIDKIPDKNDPQAQTYTVEMLYHYLYSDVQIGLERFLHSFNEARISFQRVYARTLLQETRNMTDKFSWDQRYELDLAEASLFRREENPQAALDLYHDLEAHAQPAWLVRHQREIYSGIGNAYLDQSNYNQARSYFEKCLELDTEHISLRQRAMILGQLGLISRRQGELERANDYYTESISLNREAGNVREYANTLNNMGNLQRLLGNIEDAQRYCKIALQKREKMFRDKISGEVPIGLSLSTLGIICLNTSDIAQAELYFQRAFRIYERNNYKTGIASLYVRFGQIEMAKDDLDKAMKWFRNAEQAAKVINEEAHINSLNKQGRVFTRQEKWEEAIERFEAAIASASAVNDYYQQAESWIDMAEPLERGGHHADSQESLRRGDELAHRYHYYYLLGRSQQLRGNLLLQAKRYQEAFLFLAEACHIMGQYNQIRFNSALSSLEERLMDTPEKERDSIIATLQNISWPEERLTREYERFQDALEKVQILMDV